MKTMNDHARKSNDAYIQECAQAMLLRYGRSIKIKITQTSDRKFSPRGAWFDTLVGLHLEPAGIDITSIPMRYIMANGDGIPFSCAEVIPDHPLKIGQLYFQFVFSKPYFVRPEAGEQMWQLSLGFLTITHMDDEYSRSKIL